MNIGQVNTVNERRNVITSERRIRFAVGDIAEESKNGARIRIEPVSEPEHR